MTFYEQFESADIKKLIDNIPVGVVVLESPTGAISYMNKRALELFCADPSRLEISDHSTKTVKLFTLEGQVFPPKQLPANQALNGKVIHNVDLIIEHPNHTRFVVAASATPIIAANGKINGSLGIFIDITKRSKTEEELNYANNLLKEEYEGLSKLQKISLQLVIQENMQTLLDDILKASIEITHADKGTLQLYEDGSLKIVAQYGFEDFFLKFFGNVSENAHAVCAEAMKCKSRIIVKDVNVSPIFQNNPALEIQKRAGVQAVQSTPLFSRSNKFLGVISTHYKGPTAPKQNDLRLLDLLVRQAADFIERMNYEKKLEEYSRDLEKMIEERTRQLKDAERLAAIGTTAGMVGHDIRNPLQAMVGEIYLLRDALAQMPDIPAKVEVVEGFDELEKSISYINKIVADLQDYARPLNVECVNFDLYELITNVFIPINLPEGIEISIDVDPEIKFNSDQTMIKRILTNLIINAIQAMPKGGHLNISACPHENNVLLIVEDTGVGIPDEVKHRLFMPMTTTKAKGQGLGLAVVKRLVEALNGTIGFKSELGKGTKFIIELPMNNL